MGNINTSNTPIGTHTYQHRFLSSSYNFSGTGLIKCKKYINSTIIDNIKRI